MTILKNELRKIFNLKSILILLIITGIMYKLYIIHQSGVIDSRNIIKNMFIDMIDKYGYTMDENEYKEFKGDYNDKVLVANEYIKKDKELSELGINTYDEFYKIARNNGEEKYQNEKLRELYWDYRYNEEIPVFGELDQMENVIIVYEYIVLEELPEGTDIYEDDRETEKMKNRKEEIKKSKDIQSLMPYTIFEAYELQFKWVVVLILISIILLISPIYLTDKKDSMVNLQYTSKTGRNLFKYKIWSSLIVGVLIASLQLILFFSFYKYQNVDIFLNCKISGFFNTPIKSWYDLTFGNYIVVTIICVYILSIVMSLISLFISSKVNSYMSLVGTQVVLLFVINRVLLQFLIYKVTSMHITINRIGTVNIHKYSWFIAYIVMLVVAFISVYYRNKKEFKCDIN